MSTPIPTEQATGAASKSECQHDYNTYLHPSLRWERPAMFAERAYDVATGIALCAELLSEDELRRGDSDTPVLGVNDTSNMLRFVVAAARMLASDAERCVEHMNNKAGKEQVNAVAS